MDDLGYIGFNILSILSLIISFAKEILIIILVIKLIKVSNLFLKKNSTKNLNTIDENIDKDNT